MSEGSFGAGMIEGGLKFDVSHFTGGMERVEGIAERFPELVASLLDAPLATVGHSISSIISSGAQFLGPSGVMVAGFAAIGAAAAAAAEIFHMASEVAGAAVATDLASQKAGVSIKFFSEWSAVAKHVGIDQQTLGQGMKFLQRSAVEALEGNKQLQKGFTDLGIDAKFLRANLGNVEAIFTRVRDSIAAIPDQAVRTRREWQLLGRSGSELTPLFNLPTEKVQAYMELARQHGVIEDEHSAKVGQAWKDMRLNFEESWEGMKKKISDNFMENFLSMIGEADDHMARVSNEADSGSRGGGAGGGGGVNIKEVNIRIEAGEIASQVTAQLKPYINDAVHKGKIATESAIKRAAVAAGLGGR